MGEISIRCDSRENTTDIIGSQWVVFVNNKQHVCVRVCACACLCVRVRLPGAAGRLPSTLSRESQGIPALRASTEAAERQGLGLVPQGPILVCH